MKIRSVLNGGVAEVDDEFGKQLIEAGSWEADEAKAAPVRKPRAPRKPAPVEEPKSEE